MLIFGRYKIIFQNIHYKKVFNNNISKFSRYDNLTLLNLSITLINLSIMLKKIFHLNVQDLANTAEELNS